MLVRKVYNENEPSQLVVVSYRLVDGKLIRRESRGTRDLAQLEALLATTPFAHELAPVRRAIADLEYGAALAPLARLKARALSTAEASC